MLTELEYDALPGSPLIQVQEVQLQFIFMYLQK